MQDVTERNRVREAIEQSEKRYRALMEHASDLVIVLEAQGIVTYCSPSVRDMGGYEADEVLGRNFIDYVHPGDRSAAIAALHAAVAAPATAHRTEFRLRSKDGSWRVLESVARNALADPLINGIVVNARNVTERIHAAELLRDAEARYHGIFAEARDGIVLIDAESGCATDCNPEFESQSGRTLAQLRGTPIWALRAPAMQAEARAKFEEIKAAGNGSSSELPFVRPDGTQVHVEIVSTLVRLGERNYVQSISRDVTERRLAEERREQRRERMHAQLEAVGRASMSEALNAGEVEKFARELTELAAEATGVERANVWLFNDDESELRCVDLYEATPARHSAGLVLAEREYAPEFQALKDANYVDADDALRDPRVAGYVEGYVKPLGITSMLDTAIHVTGKHLGVLCLEHVGKPHHWESDEIAFAGRLAGQFALAIVNQSRLRAQGALQKVNRALRVLSAGNMAMVRAENEKSLLAAVCRSVVEVGGYRIAWVGYAIQDDACTVEAQVAAGVSLEKLCVQPLTWEDREGGRGPCGRAIRSGHVQVVQDVQLDEGLAPWLDLARAHGIASYMSLPLHIDGEILGALNIHGSEANAFDDEEVKLLTEMAGDLAFGIRSLRVRKERDHAVVSRTSATWSGWAQRSRAPSRRSRSRSRSAIPTPRATSAAWPTSRWRSARELGLPADRIEGLRLGATIHDIGKIYVPAEILARPGRLTPAEMEIIKTHTTVGFEIIKGIDFPWPIGADRSCSTTSGSTARAIRRA